MKSIFIAAAVLLLCSAAFAVETEVSAEIETTILAMTEVEDTHAIVSMLQAEAEAAKSSQGVERLVKMLNKVLARLRRAMKRSSKRHAKGRKVCKSQLKTFSARITRARQSIRVLKTRISIAKDTAAKAVNDAAAFAKSIASGTAKAAQLDARNKVLSEEKRTKSTRWANANAETRQLIKVLRAIASKLTANGLVEVGSELTNAAASTTGTSAAMLLSIASKAKTGNDASDIKDMINLLIQTLLGDIKGNVESEAQYTRSWRNMVGAVTNSANAGRGNVKSLIAQRDRAIANGDKAKRNLLAFNVQLKAKIAKVRATKRLSKATKNSCRAAKKAFVAKRGRSLKQIRVLKEVMKTLRNTKLTAAMVTKLASVKLNLPVWKKSAWSACSKKCGLGKQTRTVSCSGKKCRGNKPRSTKSCTQGVCASDCIVSRWTSFSRCSVKCGGGIKTRTRKILAFAAGGGKACPSTAGLKQTKVCKQKACPAKQKKIVRRQQKQKKVTKVRESKKAVRKSGKVTVKSARKALKLAKQRLAKAKSNGRKAAVIARRRAAVRKARRVLAKAARKALRASKKRLARAKKNGRPAAVIARRRAAVRKARKTVAKIARKILRASKKRLARAKKNGRPAAVIARRRANVRKARASVAKIARKILRAEKKRLARAIKNGRPAAVIARRRANVRKARKSVKKIVRKMLQVAKKRLARAQKNGRAPAFVARIRASVQNDVRILSKLRVAKKSGKKNGRKRRGGLRKVKRAFKKISRKATGAVKSARKALKVARQRLAQAQANGRPAAVIARRRAAVSKAKKVWRRVRKLNKRLGPAKRAVAKSIRRLAVANRAAKAATRRVVVLRARAAANPSKQNRAAVRVAVRAQARARAVVVRARATVARVNRSFMRIVRAIVRRVFRSFGRRRG